MLHCMSTWLRHLQNDVIFPWLTCIPDFDSFSWISQTFPWLFHQKIIPLTFPWIPFSRWVATLYIHALNTLRLVRIYRVTFQEDRHTCIHLHSLGNSLKIFCLTQEVKIYLRIFFTASKHTVYMHGIDHDNILLGL